MNDQEQAPSQPSSCWKTCGMGCAGVLVVLIALVILANHVMWVQPFSRTRFNQAVWLKAAGDGNRSPRGPMTMDLRRHHLRKGMDRQQVRKLLGPPERTGFHRPDVDSYWIGAWGGFGMDYQTLDIHYNTYGQLRSSRITDH